MFLRLVDGVLAQKPVCRVLDVGGEAIYWRALEGVWSGRNLNITLLNTGIQNDVESRFAHVCGDARDMKQFADNSFDVVHSNSVIEHVGMWSDMKRMALEVRRLAPLYFVQTPNYWFPLEPHFRLLFIHWLPRPCRRRIVMWRACGFYPRAGNVDEANTVVCDASLLDEPSMRSLFPDARIIRERVGPLTKSFIAARGMPQ